MSQFTRLEQLEYDYQALLQANIRAAQDLVEAYWQSKSDPLSLPDIAEWFTGNITDGFVRSMVKKWPTITIEVTAVGPTDRHGPMVGLVDSLYVTVYTLGSTPQKADKLAHRYAAAVADVIANNRVAGVKSAGPISMLVGEAVGFQRVNYFKSSQVRSPLVIGINLKGY